MELDRSDWKKIGVCGRGVSEWERIEMSGEGLE